MRRDNAPSRPIGPSADNPRFSSRQAIANARQGSRKLQLAVQYILLIHVPLLVTATITSLTDQPQLWLPIHVVWLELLLLPTALVVFAGGPASRPVSACSGRKSASGFVASVWMWIAVVGTLLTALILWTYEHNLLSNRVLAYSRAQALLVLVAASASAAALLSRLQTKMAWLLCAATLGISALFVQASGLAAYAGLPLLHPRDWMVATLGGMLCVGGPLGAAGVFHTLRRRWRDRTARRQGADRASTALFGAEASSEPLTRYAWLSILTAFTTMGLKALAYFLTGSVALLSDAAESLANLLGAVMALIVLKVAAKPADKTHPFGHGKAEYFSSGFEGVLILAAAGGIAWKAWDRLVHPGALAALNVGMLVSVVAAVLNLATAQVLLRASRRSGSIALEADGRHLMTDVWTTAAVLVGLGGIILTGWVWLDSAMAFIAAINILAIGSRLLYRSVSGLLGAAIPVDERERIESVLDHYRKQGFQFHDLRARIAGTQRLITLHVLVPGAMTVQEGHGVLERIESKIRATVPNALIVTHLEPLEDPSSFRHETIQ